MFIGHEMKPERWAYTLKNVSPRCGSFLKIAPLKTSFLNMYRCFVCIVFASKETLRGKSNFYAKPLGCNSFRGHHRGDRTVHECAARLYWQYMRLARARVLSNAISQRSGDDRHRCQNKLKKRDPEYTFAPSVLSLKISLGSCFTSLIDRGMRRAVLVRWRRCGRFWLVVVTAKSARPQSCKLVVL